MALNGDLPAIFDEQLKRLNERGTPQPLINELASKRQAVLLVTAQLRLQEDRVPFLPVIPRTLMSINSQMQLVAFEQARGYTLLDAKKIHDIAGIPAAPYYILDIEDGSQYIDISPFAAEALIKAAGYYCLTACEAISLCVHTDVLFRHFVDAAASRYETTTQNVNILLEGSVAILGFSYISDSNPEWGTPFCRYRMK